MNKRQSAIRKFLLQNANQNFKWGSLDCVQFCSLAITAISGKEYAKNVSYKSEKEAGIILKKHGGIEGLFKHYLGEPCESISLLQDGDPCLVVLPVVGEIMGVMVSGSAMLKTENGVITVSSSRIKKGWAIECQE